jgi:hypothetical protein
MGHPKGQHHTQEMLTKLRQKVRDCHELHHKDQNCIKPHAKDDFSYFM